MEVYFANQQQAVPIPPQLEALLLAGLESCASQHQVAAGAEVDVTLVAEEEIQRLNRDYRGVDRPTDVLSFALEEGEEEPALAQELPQQLLGDIVISAPAAARQAQDYGHSLERELVYLAIHGLLHILGYNHETEEEKALMRQQEEAALAAIRLSQADLGL